MKLSDILDLIASLHSLFFIRCTRHSETGVRFTTEDKNALLISADNHRHPANWLTKLQIKQQLHQMIEMCLDVGRNTQSAGLIKSRDSHMWKSKS